MSSHEGKSNRKGADAPVSQVEIDMNQSSSKEDSPTTEKAQRKASSQGTEQGSQGPASSHEAILDGSKSQQGFRVLKVGNGQKASVGRTPKVSTLCPQKSRSAPIIEGSG